MSSTWKFCHAETRKEKNLAKLKTDKVSSHASTAITEVDAQFLTLLKNISYNLLFY